MDDSTRTVYDIRTENPYYARVFFDTAQDLIAEQPKSYLEVQAESGETFQNPSWKQISTLYQYSDMLTLSLYFTTTPSVKEDISKQYLQQH